MDLRVQFQHSESTFPTLIWPSNGPTNQDHLTGGQALLGGHQRGNKIHHR